jgi:hypothetical protein
MLSTLRGCCGRAAPVHLPHPPRLAQRVLYPQPRAFSSTGGGMLPPSPPRSQVTIAESAEQLAREIVAQTPSAELDKLLKLLQRIVKHPTAVERTAKLPKDLTWLHHWLLRAVETYVQVAKHDAARAATSAAARSAGGCVVVSPLAARGSGPPTTPSFPTLTAEKAAKKAAKGDAAAGAGSEAAATEAAEAVSTAAAAAAAEEDIAAAALARLSPPVLYPLEVPAPLGRHQV